MSQEETPQGIPSPDELMKQAEEAGRLFDFVREHPQEAQEKYHIGVAGMRTGPPPEPEPLSKSIQGPIDLSHVMDGIGRVEDQNRQILEMLRRGGPARF